MANLLQKVFALALLAEFTSANVATPMTKVVELLDDIKKKLEQDAEKESKMFNEYTNWCDREKEDSLRTIKKTKKEVSELEALLEGEEAFRKKKGSEIEKLAGEIAGNEKDLKDATVVRKHEREQFLKEERSLIESIDALERSLEVLAKKAPPGAALAQTGSASLSYAATVLRRLAERSPDFSLTAGQQQTLDAFFESAAATQNRKVGPALDFLQVDSNEAGDYESKSGGVTETLEKILVKTKAEKDEQAKKEADAKSNFQELAKALEAELEVQNKALREKKRQVAKSEQLSAEKTAELQAAKELLETTEKHLEDVKAQCLQKTIDWRSRTIKRSDEITAIKMALQILTSDAAKAMQGKQSVGSEVHLQQVSFVQTKMTTQRAHRALAKLRDSGIPALSLLATRARHRLMSSSSADPFADVKKMIRDMVTKLSKEMAEEAKKKEFCDTEMSKSSKSKHTKEKEVSKLNSRIEQLEADLSEVVDELEQLSVDMAEAQAATSEATKIRGEEKHSNLKAIKEYQDGQTLLNNAMEVLKDFYEKNPSFAQMASDAAPPETWSGGGESQEDHSGGGGGVIGIMEIAVADFAHLEEETTTAESSAAHDYEVFMKETQVQKAVWAKDLEYKDVFKVRTEGELQNAKRDLSGFQKELDAVNLYIEKLKPDCTTKVDSYEERKKRRDAELASLREALQIIQGEAIA